MNAKQLRELRAKKIDDAKTIALEASVENRPFTDSEYEQIKTLTAEAKELEVMAQKEGDGQLRKEIDDFDRKIAGGGLANAPSWKAQPATPNGWVKAFQSHMTKGGYHNFKDVADGGLTVPTLDTVITTLPDRPRSILELVGFENLDGTDLFSFERQTVNEHAAAVVARGETKPTSTYTIKKIDGRVETIAHLTEPIDNALLDDVSGLQALLQNKLLTGLQLGLENELINGDGTAGVHLEGLFHVPGTLSQAFTGDQFRTVRLALNQLETQSLLTGPFTVVMNGTTWAEQFELAQNEANGLFRLGDPGSVGGPGRTLPVDSARRQLWGSQVVTSEVLDDGVAIVGQFDPMSIAIVQRQGVTIQWTENMPVLDESGAMTSLFARNQKVWRCEGRFGVKSRRPTSFVICDDIIGGS